MNLNETIEKIIDINKKISLLSFSESLKEIMESKNMTIKELAIDAKLSLMTVSRYINNKRIPTKRSFVKLCLGLNVEFSTIIRLMIKCGIMYIPNDIEDECYLYLLSHLQEKSIKKLIKKLK